MTAMASSLKKCNHTQLIIKIWAALLQQMLTRIKLKPVVETYWPQSVGLVITHASLFTP